MTDQPVSYRDEAADLYTRAKAALDAHSNPFEDDPIEVAAVGILAGLLAIDDEPQDETLPAADHDPNEVDDDTIEQPAYSDDDEVAFRADWPGSAAWQQTDRDRIGQLLHDDT